MFVDEFEKSNSENSFIEKPFLEYFKHQLVHLSLQKRINTVVEVETKCSLHLGHCLNSEHSNVHHCFLCCNTQSCKQFKDVKCDNKKKTRSCACELLSKAPTICEQHSLLITEVESSNKGCFWNVSFVDDAYIQCQMNTDAAIELDCSMNDVDSIFIDTSLHQTLLLPDDEWDHSETESLIYYTDSEDGDANDLVHFDTSCWSNGETNIFCNKNEKLSFNKVIENDIKSDLDSTDNIEKSKCVRFAVDSELVTVHHMFAWSYAYKQSRKSVWVEAASNRFHFKRRIDTVATVLEPVLQKKLSLIDFNINNNKT